ncbi:MAG TPA: hypothetical protein VFZ00_15340 [Solirubrobacter sp.]|nr:hypothetical protein [Solirubrobacter sp.]
MTERRRRRSRDVALAAVPVLALAFASCAGDEETAYCVDQNDQIVENRYCDEDTARGGGAFFWYYGGTLAGRAVPGTKVSGGDRVSTSNISENVRRGGFGSRATSASGVGRAVGSAGG